MSLAGEIVVGKAEKHGEGIKDAFISYEIKSPGGDFSSLCKSLQIAYPMAYLAPMPPKYKLDFLDRFTPEFIAKRQEGLGRYLSYLSQHPTIAKSVVFNSFLQDEFFRTNSASSSSSDLVDAAGIFSRSAVPKGLAPVHAYVEKLCRNLGEFSAGQEAMHVAVDRLQETCMELADGLERTSLHLSNGAFEFYVQKLAGESTTAGIQQSSRSSGSLSGTSERLRQASAAYRAYSEHAAEHLHRSNDLKVYCAGFQDYLLSRLAPMLEDEVKTANDGFTGWFSEHANNILGSLLKSKHAQPPSDVSPAQVESVCRDEFATLFAVFAKELVQVISGLRVDLARLHRSNSVIWARD